MATRALLAGGVALAGPGFLATPNSALAQDVASADTKVDAVDQQLAATAAASASAATSAAPKPVGEDPLDAVHLTNGDTLRGQIKDKKEDVIVLEHPVLGTLRLPMSTVASFEWNKPPVVAKPPQPTPPTPAQPAEAKTEQPPAPKPEGETKPEQTPDKQPEEPSAPTEAAPEPAPEPTPASEPAAEPVDAPAESANEPAAPAEPPKPSAFDEWLDSWNHNLDVSFSGAQGVSRYTSYVIGYRSQRSDDTDRTNVDARIYVLDNQRTDVTEHKAHFQLQQDWFLKESNWFPFVRGRWEYDNRQYWEQRQEGYAGMGYTLAKTDDIEANIRMAGGVVHERFGADRTRIQSFLSAAVVRWKIDEQQDVSAEATFYPAINDNDVFRVNTRLEWRIKLSAIEGMSLKLGLENEFEDDKPAGQPANDTRYYAGVGFNF